MATIFTNVAESSQVNITDKDDKKGLIYNENDEVIKKIVNAFFTGAKVTIIGTALYEMNSATEGAVLSAINMVAGAANKMFVSGVSSAQGAIMTFSVVSDNMIMSSINECTSQLYQTGAAFLTIFNGIVSYFPDFFNAISKVGASIGISAGVIALNGFRQLDEEDKQRYLRKYLAKILNEIVNARQAVQQAAKDAKEGVKCSNVNNDIQELKTDVAVLTRDELAQMVEFVIPYMRSAEYNLSPEDLSFLAGVKPIHCSFVNSKSVDNLNKEIVQKMSSYENTYLGRESIQYKLLKELNDTMYRTPDVTSSQGNEYESPRIKRICTRSNSFGGKKSKRTQKRKPVIRRKQTKRVQRKQTKRVQKNRRKKQTKK
jgi:hypothetical protein